MLIIIRSTLQTSVKLIGIVALARLMDICHFLGIKTSDIFLADMYPEALRKWGHLRTMLL